MPLNGKASFDLIGDRPSNEGMSVRCPSTRPRSLLKMVDRLEHSSASRSNLFEQS